MDINLLHELLQTQSQFLLDKLLASTVKQTKRVETSFNAPCHIENNQDIAEDKHDNRSNDRVDCSQLSFTQTPVAGFKFINRVGSINWDRIEACNVERIKLNGDVQSLQAFLPDIAFGSPDFSDIDVSPKYSKLFEILQLAAQYIIHSEGVMKGRCKSLTETINDLHEVYRAERCNLSQLDEDVKQAQRVSKSLSRDIAALSEMLKLSNPALASKMSNPSQNVNKLEIYDEEAFQEKKKNFTKNVKNVNYTNLCKGSNQMTPQEESESSAFPGVPGNNHVLESRGKSISSSEWNTVEKEKYDANWTSNDNIEVQSISSDEVDIEW